MTPRIGSLFSGAGGLDLAVEHVTGGRTVWHCEADPDASKVLAAHWPGVPNLGDITAVDWSQVEPVDVLCGGFPCQDVSAAGRRAGIATGTRSGLWLEYAEAINHLRPQLVVIENVRGLLSGYAHRAMEPGSDDLGDGSGRPLLRAAGAVLGDLADLGYDATWTTIAASVVGAPHRRERVFIVATPTDADNATRNWEWSREEPRRRGQDATPDTKGDGREGFPGGPLGAQACGAGVRQPAGSAGRTPGPVDLLPTPMASRYGSNQSPSPGAAVRPGLDSIADLLPTPGASDGSGGRSAKVTGGVRASGAKRSVPLTDLPLLLPTPRTTDANGAGAHGSGGPDLRTVVAGAAAWGKYEPAIRRWESVTRSAPSPTELGVRGNPRLAATFSEWMQGWSLGWVTSVPISRSAMLRIIGNGVVPQQAIAALYWLLSVYEVAA